MSRSILLVTHTGRPDAVKVAVDVVAGLTGAGLTVRVPAAEADAFAADSVEPVVGPTPAAGCELVVVVGGDGTLLRAAELARGSSVAVLGINLGHVGFLAEAEADDLATVINRVVDRDYAVEERTAVDVSVWRGDTQVVSDWALNEASVEKAERERMIEVVVGVDASPLSRWGCDGVVCATPTGSTAYAWSAGGPVVWPDVAALLLVPLSAHALFARPMVVAPDSVIGVDLVGAAAGVLWCDGRRTHPLTPGDRIEVRVSPQAVRLARLHTAPFTDRLVAKFDLPVEGWRAGRRDTGR
jgi:NAD+ kinase